MKVTLSTTSSLLWVAGGFASCVSAKAILGVDLGSLYMKVALVQRGAPLEIVTNLHSKRKTEQMVLFDQGTRFFGADASSLLARKPTKTPAAMSVMLGRDAEHPAVKVLTERHYPLTPLYNETRKGLYLMIDGKDSYTPEELTAMVLNHAEDFTHAYGIEKGHVLGTIQDCVLTVPSFATQSERQAVLDSAELADFNVLSLIDENTAAALHFGMDKTFDEPQIILFYNLGASSLQVSVIKFHNYEVPESKYSKKMKKVGSIEVLGKAWDTTLGGQAFDSRLVNYMADHFNREWRHARKHSEDIRDIPRAMVKIRLQANKVKHVLSANTEIPVHMDSLHDDMPLSLHVSRAQFEELCDDLMERAEAPVHSAVKAANLTMEDITTIELIGGGMRVPKIQADLKEALGGKELGLHINSDESMALGAAFFGANISTAFRVRQVGLTDINPFPIAVSLEDWAEEKKGLFGSGGKKGDEDAWSKQATIFKQFGKLGVKKTIAFTHDKDVHCALDYAEPDSIPTGSVSELQRYIVTGVEDFAKEMEEKGLGKPKVSLQFELSQSGLTELVKAEAIVEEIYTVEVEEEIEEEEIEEAKDTEKTEEATEDAEGDATERKTEETDEEEKKEDAAEDSEEKKEKDAADDSEEKKEKDTAEDSDEKKEEEKAKPAEKKPKKMKLVEKEKKKLHKKTLTVEKYYSGKVQPMSKELKEESNAKMAALTLKDKERVMLEAAKNKVESYIYLIKNKLIDNEEEVAKVATEEQREELRKLSEDGEEWLYDDGYNADLATMEAKYAELSEPSEKVWFRMAEMTARPEAIGSLNKKLDKVEEILKKWEASMPQITEEERSDVMEKVEEVRKWISEKTAEQEGKAAHEEPAFTSEEVPPQTKSLERIMSKLSKKPKPKPVKKEEDKNTTEAKGEGESEGEGSDEEKTEGEAKEEVAEGSDEEKTENEAKEEVTEGSDEEKTENEAKESAPVAEGEDKDGDDEL